MRVKLATVKRLTAACAAITAGLAALGIGALAGCPATATTTGYTPITGIEVRASLLTAGYGCGTARGEVYKYAVLVSYVEEGGPATPPVYSGIFDCFADGVFSNLPASEAGGVSFDLSVLAWDEASFPAALECPPSGATACPGDDPGTVLAKQGTPTLTTSCTATQQQGIAVTAVCAPLEGPQATVNDAGIPDALDGGAGEGGPVVIDTHGFVLADGGSVTCGDEYNSARATFVVGTASGEVTPVACPAPLVISPTVVGGVYDVTVELLLIDTPVAQATCRATASTGSSSATCAPATLE